MKNMSGERRTTLGPPISMSRTNFQGMPFTGSPDRLMNSWNIRVCCDSSMSS